MAIITVKNLSKDYKIKEKEKGFKGSIKSIIKPKYTIKKAVNNISFEVEKIRRTGIFCANNEIFS